MFRTREPNKPNNNNNSTIAKPIALTKGALNLQAPTKYTNLFDWFMIWYELIRLSCMHWQAAWGNRIHDSHKTPNQILNATERITTPNTFDFFFIFLDLILHFFLFFLSAFPAFIFLEFLLRNKEKKQKKNKTVWKSSSKCR